MNSAPPAPTLVLASRSPQRVALIARLGLAVVVRPSAVDEVAVATPPDPPGVVQALAAAKAWDVAKARPTDLVLGADTLVALDGSTLGKPADAAAAAAMLRRLSGRTHDVLTGLTVLTPQSNLASCPADRETLPAALQETFPHASVATFVTHRAYSITVRSTVRIRALGAAEVAAYVASGEPMGKAGAYGIQGAGARLIAALDGCYSNVVGLPLCAVAALLTVALGRAVPCAPDANCRPNGAPGCTCATVAATAPAAFTPALRLSE